MSTSMIRAMLLEAPEELALPKEPVTAAPTSGGVAMNDTDFAPPAPMATAGAAAPLSPINTGGPAGPNVIQKEVQDKSKIIAITKQLKSIIANLEKTFDGDDLSVADANNEIHEFLMTLAFFADKYAEIIGQNLGTGAEEAPAIPEAPMSEPPMPEPMPEPVPEAPIDMNEPQPATEESMFTEPAPQEESMFTEPGAV